jgi:hypothetical protein
MFRLTYRHTRREEPSHDWRRVATAEQATTLARQARAPVHRKKIKTPVGVFTKPSGGNPHRNHSGKTPTTGHSGKTPTTLESLGVGLRGGANVSEPPNEAPRPIPDPDSPAPGDQYLLPLLVSLEGRRRC